LAPAPPHGVPVGASLPSEPPPAPPGPPKSAAVEPVLPPPPSAPARAPIPDTRQVPTREELYAKALADFNEAIRRNPNLAFAHASRGRLHQARQEFDKALADLKEAIRLDPTGDLSYYATRAEIYSSMGHHAEAAADYTTILDHNSQLTEAFWKRSEEYRKAGDFQKALTDCQKLNLLLFVEVVSESAPLKSGEDLVGTVTKGDELQVTQVNGNWLWVEAVLPNGNTVQGWIDQKRVK
jgi:hypothetical protein